MDNNVLQCWRSTNCCRVCSSILSHGLHVSSRENPCLSQWVCLRSKLRCCCCWIPAGIKLREANQQQQFNRNVEDIELWLYEVEGHLASDDYGKDLTSVQNLQKKQALLEADVAAHQVPTTIIHISDGQIIISQNCCISQVPLFRFLVVHMTSYSQVWLIYIFLNVNSQRLT